MNEYVGEIGKRIRFQCLITHIIAVKCSWGRVWLHKARTPENDILVWFCSKEKRRLEVGQAYMLVGIVKKHEERRGVRQTLMQRVKAVSV